mmetsp:Transcript_38334/g.121008  ORF Transcript_38334/g.121008 Transcript_38334/m.121008 type:complete len:216 (-) Transcript_38334:29-676(-)
MPSTARREALRSSCCASLSCHSRSSSELLVLLSWRYPSSSGRSAPCTSLSSTPSSTSCFAIVSGACLWKTRMYTHSASASRSSSVQGGGSPAPSTGTCSRSGMSSARTCSSISVKKCFSMRLGSMARVALRSAAARAFFALSSRLRPPPSSSESAMSSSSSRSSSATSICACLERLYISRRSVTSPKISCASRSAYDDTIDELFFFFFFFFFFSA